MKDSKIEWTHHTANLWQKSMFFFVASFTKGYSVGQFKTQIGMVGKMLNVMCVKIASLIVATLLTSKFISGKHIKPPTLVIIGTPDTFSFNHFSVFVRMAFVAFSSSYTKYLAYLNSCFNRVSFAIHRRFIALSLVGQKLSCFVSMMFAFKGAYSALPRLFNLNPNTGKAFSRKSTTSTVVNTKISFGFPRFTFRTPIFIDYFNQIIFIRKSCFFSSNFLNTYNTSHINTII